MGDTHITGRHIGGGSHITSDMFAVTCDQVCFFFFGTASEYKGGRV